MTTIFVIKSLLLGSVHCPVKRESDIEINYWEQRLPILQSTVILFRRLEIIEVSVDISGNKNNEIKASMA